MIKIVVDSGCDISNETITKNNINIQKVPLSLQIGDKVYIDDDTLDLDKYMDEMSKSPNPPKTAAPSPELYSQSFKNADSVFVVTISSKLSGSHNSANLGKQMLIEQEGDKFVHIIDSESASAGESTIVMKLNELILANFTANEIKEKITSFLKEMKTYVILDKYDNLIKTGRLNPTVGKIASMLSIKPICHAKDGEIAIFDKVRGQKKLISRLIEIILKDNLDFENRILSISHVKCYEKALEIKDSIMQKIKFKEAIITETTGLCSTYADKNGIVVSF